MISASEVYTEAHRVGMADPVIEKDYVLSWLLVAIAESDLRCEIAFKGGTALKRVYYPNYRYSEDLDFTLCNGPSHEDLIQTFQGLFPWLAQHVNLTFELRTDRESTLRTTTLLVNYVGPLQARLGSRYLKVDFSRGEQILDPLLDLHLGAPYTDYPQGVTLPTYSLKDILTEKLRSLLQRTEPRDLYDIHWLFQYGDVDRTFLRHSFARKCEHKGLDPAQLDNVLQGKAAAFEKLWASRLTEQVTELPHFNEVFRVVRRHVRDLGLG